VSRSTTNPEKHTMKTKHKKLTAGAMLAKIEAMPNATADEMIRRLMEDLASAQMALEMALAARSKAAA
jgi:hypothetical protein